MKMGKQYNSTAKQKKRNAEGYFEYSPENCWLIYA